MSNGKAIIIHLIIVLLKKKLLYRMSQYFAELNEYFDRNVKFALDLSNYAIRTDLKKQ